MNEEQKIKQLVYMIGMQDDLPAYKELFLLLNKRLRQFAYGILKSKEEAEELVSDVFIKIWEKRKQLQAVESPRLYFYTITKNLAINRIRERKNFSEIDLNDWLLHGESVYFDPEKLMIAEEMRRQVRQAIDELPNRCRLIFKLVKDDGLRHKEVAELLQLSIKTIESQIAIALRRIANCMLFQINFPSLNTRVKKS
jgi:RNA polymerase sigma-70 factor (family 1)